MKVKHLILPVGILVFFFVFSCTKKIIPVPPPTDSTGVNSDTINSDTVNLKLGLLLYLPFNGSFADSSGNNNIVTPVAGAQLTYDQHGFPNMAFGGNGTGARLKVTNNGSIKFDTAYSITYDFTIFSNTGRQAFLSLISPTDATSGGFGTGVMTPGLSSLDFNTADTAENQCGVLGNPITSTTDTTSFIPQVSAWYNVICTYQRGTEQVFINGTLVSTKTKSAGAGGVAFDCPDAQVIVGGWWDNDPISINGIIDNIRIYSRVLNSAEVTYLSRGFQH